MRIGASAAESGNAFDFIRVAAAFAVLYSHSFAILKIPEPLSIFGFSPGRIAVFVFFIISGYLICQSWDRDPNVVRFAMRRALRLLPGLGMAVCLTVLVLGPLVTTVPLGRYFLSETTWAYIFSNATLVGGQRSLPGVFETNPYTNVVNGSLWTLRYEAIMYAALAAIGVMLARSGHLMRYAIAGVTVLFVAAWCASDVYGIETHFLPLPIVWRIGFEIDGIWILWFGAVFFAGATLYYFRHGLRLSIGWAIACCIACAMLADTRWGAVLVLTTLPYVTLVVAYRAPDVFKRFGKGHDLSYGIYVYAFPVQQAACYLLGSRWFACFVLSTVVTLALAWLSWRFVESRALAWKPRRNRAPSVSTLADVA